MKSLDNIETIESKIMCTNRKPCTTIVSCNNLANASDETDTTSFYHKLYSLVRHIP